MFDGMTIAFLSYFGCLLSFGLFFYKKSNQPDDFALGGRTLNYWVTAISAQASDMSDWLFMAFPGVIYLTGLSEIWIGIGLVLFMFLTWQFIAPKFRIATEKTNTVTLASFFSVTFQDKSNLIKIISSLLCLYFFVFYIAAGINGLGKVFACAFDMNYFVGIVLGLSITIAYTMLGGFLAIAWSDLFQGTLLLAAIMFVPCYVLAHLGGITALTTAIHDQNFFSLWPQHSTSLFAVAIGILSWGLGYFGQPHILINFMSIKEPEKISKAKLVGCTWQILALGSAAAVGIVGKAFFTTPLENRELVFIKMVQLLFHPFVAGIILCAILAATISTINTQALVSASLLSQDLYSTLINPQGTAEQKLHFTRLGIFIIPLLALLVALKQSAYVMDLVLYAWSGLGSCFGPIVIASLYCKEKITRNGALAGLISGGIVSIFWPLLHTNIPTLVVGYTVNFICMFAISQFELKK